MVTNNLTDVGGFVGQLAQPVSRASYKGNSRNDVIQSATKNGKCLHDISLAGQNDGKGMGSTF